MALFEFRFDGFGVKQIMQSLRSLHEKVDFIMSDVQELSDTLDAIVTDVTAVQTEIADLETDLANLRGQLAANQPVDLTGVLTKAQSIRAALDAVVANAPSPSPAPEPVPAPASTTVETPASDAGGEGDTPAS